MEESGDPKAIRILDKKSFGTFFYFSIISSCLALKFIILNNSRKELYRIICISIMNCILMHRCKIIEKSNMWIIKNDISILDQKRPELTVM